MPAAPYRITRKDASFVWAYLSRKMHDPEFPSEASHSAAKRNFSDGRPAELNAWCDKYLSADEWRKMRTAARQAVNRRSRRDEERKTLTISHKAWQFAAELAEREECTISEVLEHYLQRVARGAPTKRRQVKRKPR